MSNLLSHKNYSGTVEYSNAGHSIPATSGKADLYRRQELLYTEPVLTAAVTKMTEGNIWKYA